MADEPRKRDRSSEGFDHHSGEFAKDPYAMYSALRSRCPVAWTDAHEGFWVLTQYQDVASVAQDDYTFSSANDVGKGPMKGVTIPTARKLPSGMIETDPPRFMKLRQAVNPWFSPAAVERMRPLILEATTFFIDRFIESGECDLTIDLTGPVPALLTMSVLGLPLDDWRVYSDALHRGIHTPPGHPERDEVEGLMDWVVAQLFEAAEDRRAHPRDDLISFFATLEIDGERLPLEEVVGNEFLVMAGGVDTTTALMSHTLLHLHRDREARRTLMEDPSRMRQACEEYLRYFTPVQGMSRTVTAPCRVGDTSIEPLERVWMSWAAINRDPKMFDAPDEIQLDRFPNRHASFGLGSHRCLGSNMARAAWSIVIGEVFKRMPDYEIDEASCAKYSSIGVVDGWVCLPARFSPGTQVGTSLAL